MSPVRVAAGLVLALGLGTVSARAEFLDQFYEPIPNNGIIVSSTQTVAQTFTVGLTGVLNRIEIEAARNSVPPSADLIVEIHPTLADGRPSDTVLAQVMLAPLLIPPAPGPVPTSFVNVDLLDAGLFFTEGELLAIVLRTNAPATGGGVNPYAWSGDSGGSYPGGVGYVSIRDGPFFPTTIDFGFRTYVGPTSIPEPSSLGLLGLGALSLLGYAWRRQKQAASRIATD